MAIVPTARDPQQNTAECLLKKDAISSLNSLGKTSLLITAISQLSFAFLGGISFAYTYKVWAKKKVNNLNKVALALFGKVAVASEFLLSVAVFAISFPWKSKLPFDFLDMYDGNYLYTSYFPFFFHSFILFCFIFFVVICKRSMNLYPLFMAICYHFSWIVIAVFTDPFWAIPIFLTISVTCLFVFLLIYEHIAQSKGNVKKFYFESVRTVVCFWALCGFASFLCFLTFSVHYFLANQTLFGFFQTSLMSVLGLLASVILYKFPGVMTNGEPSPFTLQEMHQLFGSRRTVNFETNAQSEC